MLITKVKFKINYLELVQRKGIFIIFNTNLKYIKLRIEQDYNQTILYLHKKGENG